MSVHTGRDAPSAAGGSTAPVRAGRRRVQGQWEAEGVGVGEALKTGGPDGAPLVAGPPGAFAAPVAVPDPGAGGALGRAAAALGTWTGVGQAVRLAGAPASTGTAVGRMPQPAAAPASSTRAAVLRTAVARRAVRARPAVAGSAAVTGRPPGWAG